jgi:phage FluMu protein Com
VIQIRCVYCQKPFGLDMETIHAALDEIHTRDLGHYNAPCPHCRKINRVSLKELKRAAPEWKAQHSEGG